MIHILYMNVNILEDKTLFEKGMSIISEDRKNKIKKYKNLMPARLSLGAGILLRIALEEQGLLDKMENIQYAKYGKPYLSGNPVYFNLSHSGEYAVCVYGNKPIGADLQKIKVEIPKHTNKILSKEEKRYLDRLEEEEKLSAFYQLWARKESLIKWDGRGLRIPLEEQSVISPEIIFNEKKVYFHDSDILFPEYALSICTEMHDSKVNLRDGVSIFLTKY